MQIVPCRRNRTRILKCNYLQCFRAMQNAQENGSTGANALMCGWRNYCNGSGFAEHADKFWVHLRTQTKSLRVFQELPLHGI